MRFFVLLLFCIFSFSKLFAGDYFDRPRYSSEFEIINESSRVLNCIPGQTITAVFNVSNKADKTAELNETLILPDQWQLEIPMGVFHLPGKVAQSRYAAFRCPEATPAGTYRVEYVVNNNQNPDQQSSTFCIVNIIKKTAVAPQKTTETKPASAKPVLSALPEGYLPNPTQMKRVLETGELSEKPAKFEQPDFNSAASLSNADLSLPNPTQKHSSATVEEKKTEEDEPAKTESVKVEPTKIEPAKTELVKDVPAKTEPVHATQESAVFEQADTGKSAIIVEPLSGSFLANPTQKQPLANKLEETSEDIQTTIATEPATVAEPASVTEPVSATEPASTAEPVSSTEPVSATKPASTTEQLVLPVQETSAQQENIEDSAAEVVQPADTEHSATAACETGVSDDISIKLVTSAKSDLLPGELVSLTFLVTNNSAETLDLVENVEFPEGYSSLLPADTFALAPGETQTGILSFSVPNNAEAGKKWVTYGISSQKSPSVKNYAKFNFSVSPVSRIRMFLENIPSSLIAGQELQATIQILNEGNVKFDALIRAPAGYGFQVRIDPEVIALEPGANTTVKLMIRASENVRDFRNVILRLKAINLADDSQIELGEVSQGLSLFPEDSEKIDLDRVIPARLVLRTSGGEGNQATQTEISGAGKLDSAGNKFVDFLLRSPDQERVSIFGLRDEYRFNYRDQKLSLRTGDQSYYLSYLTDYYRYGRGIEANFAVTDDTQVGYHQLQTRWEIPQRNQSGFHLSQKLNEKLQLRLNHLVKELPLNGGFRGEQAKVSSIEVDLLPSPKSSLHVELGRSSAEDSVADGKRAYHIEYGADLENQTNLRVTRTFADPGYGGYLENTDILHGYLSFPVNTSVNGYADYYSTQQQIDLNSAGKSANSEKRSQLGFNFILNNTLSATINVEKLNRFDKYLPSDYDFDELATRLSVSKKWNDISLRWDTRRARRIDSIFSDESFYNSHNYYLTYSQSSRFNCSIYGGFTNYAGMHGYGTARDSNSIGISSHWSLSEKFDLQFWYLKYRYEDAENRDSQGDLTINYKFEKDCSLSFRVRNNVSWQTNEGPTYYELAYYMPLDIPVGKNSSIGAVRGTIYDMDRDKKPSAKISLMMNGKAAITNKNGQFAFANIPPGTYSINIDRASFAAHKITSCPMPLEVVVKGGQITTLEIGIVDGCQLKGKLYSTRPVSTDSTKLDREIGLEDAEKFVQSTSAKHLSNIIVELELNGEVVRRLSSNGEYNFSGLKPGKWHYKVFNDNLPPNAAFSQSEGELELKPGETKVHNFEIVQRVKLIEFIDEGEVEVINTN